MSLSLLEQNMIELFKLMKVNSMVTWHMANLIYNDCMTIPRRGNGGRVSGICRTANKSRFMKLEDGVIYYSEAGFVK